MTRLKIFAKFRPTWRFWLMAAGLAVFAVIAGLGVHLYLLYSWHETEVWGGCYEGDVPGLGHVFLNLGRTADKDALLQGNFFVTDAPVTGFFLQQRPDGSSIKLNVESQEHMEGCSTSLGVIEVSPDSNAETFRGAYWPPDQLTGPKFTLRRVAGRRQISRQTHGTDGTGLVAAMSFRGQYPVFPNATSFQYDASRQLLASAKTAEPELANPGSPWQMGPPAAKPSYSKDWTGDLLISLVYVSPHLISAHADDYVYSGGVHGNTHSVTSNFVESNGRAREFALEDLFIPASNWAKTLSNFCIADLRRQGASDFDNYAAWVKAHPAGILPSELARFTVTPAALQIYFDPYAMGSHVEGGYVVNIPWGTVREFLRADGPAKYFPVAVEAKK